jgi:hypothetical protein
MKDTAKATEELEQTLIATANLLATVKIARMAFVDKAELILKSDGPVSEAILQLQLAGLVGIADVINEAIQAFNNIQASVTGWEEYCKS